MIFAYDTTQRDTVLSWQYAGEAVQTRTWERAKATEVLLPAMAEIRGNRPLTALAVITGPGSFTGIRVGLAVAQGLTAVLPIQAYGFTRHELAAPYVGDGLLVLGVARGGAVCVSVKAGKLAGEVGLKAVEALAGETLVSLEPLNGLNSRVVEVPLTEISLKLTAAQPDPEQHPLSPCYVRPADAVAGRSLVARLLAQ